jgi:hypothetical protein
MLEDCAALTPKDFHKFYKKLTLLKVTKDELYKLVRLEYHHLIDLWDPKEAETLPTSKPNVDHSIRTAEGAATPHLKAYRLS